MNGKVRISLYRVTCTYVLIFAMFSGSSSLIASYCPKTSYALFGNSGNFSTGGEDAGLTTLLYVTLLLLVHTDQHHP